MVAQYAYSNTVVQVWCLNGQIQGGFFVYLVDGNGNPLHLVGECSWPFGDNTWGLTPPPGGTGTPPALSGTTWKSVDGPGDAHTPTGDYWLYNYDASGNTLTQQKFNSAGTPYPGKSFSGTPFVVTPAALATPAAADTVYAGLHGSTDPELCSAALAGGVGGIAEAPSGGSQSAKPVADSHSGSSVRGYASITGGLAVAFFVALAAVGSRWYVSRRRAR
jgi:hypothetical protein